MYKPLFNQRKALRFRHFIRKGYALFACLGRVVTIGVLSVATLQSASAATDDFSTKTEKSDDSHQPVDKEATLDDVEVTGSRAPLALQQAARMVTVLSREDIQAAPVHSINDLLKMVVGVDVRQRGPIGAQTDVGIRGGTSEQIAVLLNGINICDPQTGHNTFDFPCDLSDILRIEILEGPAGRIYGTSSLVGAINIVTRDARSQKAEVRVEGGSYGYLSTAGRAHIGSHSLSASFTRSDGYSRAKSGTLNADYCGLKTFWNSQFSILNSQFQCHAGISAKGYGSNTFYSAKFDEQYERTVKIYTALQGDITAGNLHFKPSIYWNRSQDRFELIRGSEDMVPFNHHRTDVFGLNLNSWFDSSLGRTALGAEFRNEDIVSTNLGEPLSDPFSHYKVGLNRSNLTFHLEHNVLLNRFTLSAGFIAVKNTWNQMPFTLYPGLDASLWLNERWKVYASYNASLRMPSFTELYYSVGGHKADKYLKPEELCAVEGGVKYQYGPLSVKAGIFHHHQRNTIDWVIDTRDEEPCWQSVNLTRINTLGQEVTISCQLAAVNWQLSYCHLHQQKDTPGYLQSQYALEYLRHKLTANLQMQLSSRLSATVCCRWQDRTGSYTTVDGTVCSYRPYAVLDARLAWQASHATYFVEGNNLTSHRYIDYGNVPQPGCWFKAGFKLNY